MYFALLTNCNFRLGWLIFLMNSTAERSRLRDEHLTVVYVCLVCRVSSELCHIYWYLYRHSEVCSLHACDQVILLFTSIFLM